MSDAIATLLSALIGAGLGSLGGAYLTYFLSEYQGARRLREKVIQDYLLQLQEAVDALWYRLDNVKNWGGRAVMADRYFEISTLYALGQVLAYERILLIDGIYPQLERVSQGLAVCLRKNLHQIDQCLSAPDQKGKDIQFQRYDRLTLAESVIMRETDHLRTSTYLEYCQIYEKEDSLLKSSLAPAKRYIAELNGSELSQILDHLDKIARRLETETKIPSTIQSEV